MENLGINLLSMKIGDWEKVRMELTGFEVIVTRVPGGWIYVYKSYNSSQGGTTSQFIPIDGLM